MGAHSSRPEYSPLAPRSFYLVVGGPPIRYLRPGAGPLIFNMELPRREGPELVEETSSIKNLVNVGSKHPLKLLAVEPRHPERGFLLNVVIDAAVAPEAVRLYVGAEIEAVAGEGLRVRPIKPDQPQFLVGEQLDGFAVADAPGTPTGDSQPPMPPPNTALRPFATRSGASHDPILLQNLTPAQPAAELRAPGSLRQCPILLRTDYTAETFVEGREGEPVCCNERRVLYTALSFSAQEFERMRTDAAKPRSSNPAESLPDPPTLRLVVVKQFLEVHTASTPSDGVATDAVEVYELDDIFDLAGESVAPPLAASPSTAVDVAAAGGAADGGGGGSSPPQTSQVGAELVAAEDEDDANVCVVCLTNPKDTVIIPCRHMCLCGECAAVLRQQSNKCPICRQTIDRLMTRRT